MIKLKSLVKLFQDETLTSTIVDFICGQKIHSSENLKIRRAFLYCSVVVNIGLLGFFKYFNFFLENLYSLLFSFGINPERLHLHIILPVGISFYTFQTLSYTIDIYRKQLTPCKGFIDFALFVAFFPQLVAGPIERAKHMLPQIYSKRTLTYIEFEKGVWLIFWGLFKKVFIADNLAMIVNNNFARSAGLSFPVAYLSVVAFAFQIYCDFSAYTDIARGTAKLLGFDLMKNFNLPYMAENPRDFWRRWHISLSTWLRDYLYIPLGGSRIGKYITMRNLLITMILGGLWHGAAWNYILWGTYHGLLLVGYNCISERKKLYLGKWVSILIMNQFTLFGWLLFRCIRSEVIDGVCVDQSFQQIMEFFGTFSRSFQLDLFFWMLLGNIAFFIAPLIFVQILQYQYKNKYVVLDLPSYISLPFKAAVLFLIVCYGVQHSDAFIYFQF